MSTGLSPVWAFPVPPDDPTFTAPPILSPTMPLPGAGGPPEPPQFVPPEVLAATRPGFRERLGMALADTPDFVPSRGATGGQSFLGGLLSGAAQGFSRGVAGEAKTARETREQANALSKAEADRNWANAQETWRQKFRAYYRAKEAADGSGDILINAKMASDARLPKSRIGTRIAPKDFADLVAGAAQMPPVPVVTKPAPRPRPAPKESPSEKRRMTIASMLADLARKGHGDRMGVEAYLNQPGVIDALARQGITRADVLRQVPE